MKKILITTAIAASLVGMSSTSFADPCKLNFAKISQDPSAFSQQVSKCQYVFLAFKQGDQVPVSFSGNLLQSNLAQKNYAAVQQNFWLKIPLLAQGNPSISLDGKHYQPVSKFMKNNGTLNFDQTFDLNLQVNS